MGITKATAPGGDPLQSTHTTKSKIFLQLIYSMLLVDYMDPYYALPRILAVVLAWNRSADLPAPDPNSDHAIQAATGCPPLCGTTCAAYCPDSCTS